LVAEGHSDRILLSSDAIGYAIGHDARELPYDHVLATFVPRLRQGASRSQTSSGCS